MKSAGQAPKADADGPYLLAPTCRIDTALGHRRGNPTVGFGLARLRLEQRL